MLSRLRLPTPGKFLGYFDLHYGADIVLMSLLVNKCSGVFGVLAMLGGVKFSAIQFSMYFYSLLLFALLCHIGPSIRSRNPLAAISFAYITLLDALINILYTLLFGFSWFLVLAQKYHAASNTAIKSAAGTIDHHAGFTSPAYNISHVTVSSSGQEAVAIPASSAEVPESFSSGVLQPESATSILLIAAFWVVRLYFIIVAFAWARQVVRASATSIEGPFEGRNGGQGWQGRLGRAMVGVGRGYWMGEGWIFHGGNKFRRDSGDRRRWGRRGSGEV
ncbi:Inositolphosphorylceramide synthase subunit Kei1-domain-containing protein [Pyronema omphalodes]|nr:Inositolphosphorylceramide synthase subunit Kei1-domain-containing protein [Pyronema omphalodes]